MVGLDPVVGHEQAGVRPAVLVSDPARLKDSRFPLVAVVPVTRTKVHGPFVIPLPAGAGGLRADSHALIDQIRSVDVRRIIRVYSVLDPEHIARISTSLKTFLGV